MVCVICTLHQITFPLFHFTNEETDTLETYSVAMDLVLSGSKCIGSFCICEHGKLTNLYYNSLILFLFSYLPSKPTKDPLSPYLAFIKISSAFEPSPPLLSFLPLSNFPVSSLLLSVPSKEAAKDNGHRAPAGHLVYSPPAGTVSKSKACQIAHSCRHLTCLQHKKMLIMIYT